MLNTLTISIVITFPIVVQLIKGEGVNEAVESYLRGKNLLYNNVVHYPYEKTLGANYYVTKYIGSDKIEWGIF